MNENYILALEITKKRFRIDDDCFPLFFLCLYGLFSKYSDYKEIVIDVFLNTLILIGDKNIREIMVQNNIDPNEYYICDDEVDNDSVVLGVSSNGFNYAFCDDKSEFVKQEENPFIVCSTMYSNNSSLLMTMLHEFSHLVKGRVNATYPTKDHDCFGYTIRCGLNIYELSYFPTDDSYFENVSFNILDEVINCLQTTDMGLEILALDGIIPDSNINSFFDTLDKKILSEDLGYEAATKSIRSLWENLVFKNLIEENIVYGNVNKIIDDFDFILGNGSYDNLNDLLLTIDNLDASGLNDSLDMLNAFLEVDTMIKVFDDKTRYFIKTK